MGYIILIDVLLLCLYREKPLSNMKQCILGPVVPLYGFIKIPLKYYILCCYFLICERVISG